MKKPPLENIQIFESTPEGRKYIEYYNKVEEANAPIDFFIPDGLPRSVEELGGAMIIYEKCIQANTTWQKILGYETEAE